MNTVSSAATPELLGCRVSPLCLRLRGGAVDGQEVRLTSAKVSVGGAPGTTLRLRSPSALPLYVWILRGPEGCLVRRFAPQVLLNGGAFDEAPLCDGDRLRIGGIELEIVSGAQARPVEIGLDEAEDLAEPFAGRRTDNQAASAEPSSADPWLRPLKRAFASGANQTSRQRRSLRQHHARRTRKLLEALRQQDGQLQHLHFALEQQQAETARLASAQQAASETERIRLEEEAHDLAALVEQMTNELREAAAQRELTAADLEQQGKLRSEIEQREHELNRVREEADEARRSTAAQIEQMTHAFELLRQERDDLADRQEREAAAARKTQATLDTLHAELTEAQARHGALQARLEVMTEQLAAAEEQRSSQQPQLEQQVKFLQVEIERRDRELSEARSAAAAQGQQTLASLEQLREEMAELQTVRQRERQQASAEADRLIDELTELRTQLSAREAEARTVRTSSEKELAALRTELERAQAEATHARQWMARERSDAAATRAQWEAELASLEQQLERRTADLQAVQQTAGAEAEHFAKTIEQLRAELQNERNLREQEAEARQADRRRSEAEVAAARREASELTAQVEQSQREQNAEISRLTLLVDEAQREAADKQAQLDAEQAKLSAEQLRWEEERDQLKQTISELTTARIAADQRELRTEDLRLQAAEEVSRLSTELEAWQQQAAELHAGFDAQRGEWDEQRQALQQKIDELLASQQVAAESQAHASELNQQAAVEIERLTGELEQWRQEAAQLQASLEAEQARGSEEIARLQQQIDQLVSEHRDQVEQRAEGGGWVDVDPERLQSELRLAGEQLQQLSGQNHQLQEQVAELQLTLEDAHAQLARLESASLVAAEGTPEASAIGDEAQQQLVAAQQQLENEKHELQQQREAWESSLQQREEELAAQIAELERQVGEWHERQLSERRVAEEAVQQPLPYAPDAVFGSYTPPHSELPPDLTMPLPRGLADEAPDADRSAMPSGYCETAPFPASGSFDDAEQPSAEPAGELNLECGSHGSGVLPGQNLSEAEQARTPVPQQVEQHGDEAEADPASDPPRDSDSVTAVLGRLMQAGLWQADSNNPGDEAQGLACTMPVPCIDDARLAAEAEFANQGAAPQPAFDAPQHDELPQQLPESTADEGAYSCTMDMASVMAERDEAPRSWRAEMLGNEEPVAGSAELSHEQAAEAPHANVDENLPEQAIGHGSWRAQLLGAQEPSEDTEPAADFQDSASAMEATAEEPADLAPPTFTPVSPPAAEPASDDDDSIEAYMSKLLKRVRGDEAEAAWKPAPVVATPVVEARPAAAAPKKAEAVPQPVDPVDPSEFVPQRLAPEATVSLAAMREIANAASKVAIATHAKRRHTERFAQRLAKAVLALLSTAGFAAWGIYGQQSAAWYGVAVGLLLMAYWIAQSLWHITKALRLKPAKVALSRSEETDETQADEDGMGEAQA